jgi:hypothetical protein
VSTTWTETISPFGSSGNSPGQLFENDVIVYEAAPGVVLNGTEPNNVWAEYREVGGDSFLATNAEYVSGTGWTQVNPSLPSYALALRADGEIDRLYANFGASVPLTWTTVLTIDPFGNFVSDGLPLTLPSQVAFSLSPTWNAGSSVMTAFEINVTDSSSNANSLLFNAVVNGTSVFSINKEGQVSFGGSGGSTTNPGSTSLPGGGEMIWGYTAGVAADDSASAVISYAAPFANATLSVAPTIDTGSSAGASAYTIRWFSPTATGFSVHVSGGPAGATVTVSFIAIGH